MVVLRKELCALNFRKMHTKSEKNIKKFILSFFINQDRKKCSHYFNSSVFWCKMLVLFQNSYIEGSGSATIKQQNIIIQR